MGILNFVAMTAMAFAGEKGKLCSLIPTPAMVDAEVSVLSVPIKRFSMALTDGREFPLEWERQDLNFLGLSAQGSGIVFTLPLGTESYAIEGFWLETYAHGHAEMLSRVTGDEFCHLKVPHQVFLRAKTVVEAGVTFLIKQQNRASQILEFNPKGSPCKKGEFKCELSEDLPVTLRRYVDEF